MVGEQELIRLIDAAIDAKLDKMRMKVTEVSGRGGDTVISSRGDIYFQPGDGRRAIYKGTEIGSGSGSGAVTSVFGRTGAVTAQDSDYVNYLLLDGTRKMTGALYINMTTPSIALQTAASTKAALQWDGTDTVLTSYSGKVIIDPPTGSTIDLRTNNVTRLSVADAAITTTLPVGINISNPTGKLQVNQSTDVNLLVHTVAAGAITLSAINDNNTLNIPLELRGSQVLISSGDVGIGMTPTQMLSVAGIVLSKGDSAGFSLSNTGATSSLRLNWFSGDSLHRIESTASTVVLQTLDTSKNVILANNDVAKLTVSNTAITAAVTLAMSGTKITGLAAGTTNGDAVRYEQLITDHGALTGLTDDDHTQYLLLTAGSGRKLTGSLYINNTNPILYLEYSGSTRGTFLANETTCQLYSTSVPLYIGDVDLATTMYGSSIALATGVTPTTRLTIADAAITAAVDLYMGANYIYLGTDTADAYISAGHDTNLNIRSYTGGGLINMISQVETYSNIVPYVSGQSCGTADQKWSLVRGTTITSGDIGFDERICAVCNEELKVGEVLSLIVVEVGDNKEAPTRCVPIHNHHKHGDTYIWNKRINKPP